jgi:hypothetical protein
MIFNEVIRRWFGLDPRHCEACEILRAQLEQSSRERLDLLNRLLDKDKVEPPTVTSVEEYEPIKPQFIPWRVRQQMFEAEDRKAAQLMRDKIKEMKEVDPSIERLEKEVGLNAGQK